MIIRFLQTVPSANPEAPFHLGQQIQVDHPTPDLLALVDGVRAIALPDVQPETAVARAPKRSKGWPK